MPDVLTLVESPNRKEKKENDTSVRFQSISARACTSPVSGRQRTSLGPQANERTRAIEMGALPRLYLRTDSLLQCSHKESHGQAKPAAALTLRSAVRLVNPVSEQSTQWSFSPVPDRDAAAPGDGPTPRSRTLLTSGSCGPPAAWLGGSRQQEQLER